MIVTQFALYIFLGVMGTVVALTREPLKQCIVTGFFGLILVLLLFSLHALDVCLAAIVVSSIGIPMMILLTLARVRRIK